MAAMKFCGVLFLFVALLMSDAFGQIEIITPKDSAVSAVDRQAVTVHSWPGARVELLVNNVSVKIDTVRVDGLLDFINIQVPLGDVEFSARLLQPDGTPAQTVSRHMHILGPPASIVVELERTELSADGISSTKGFITLFDRWKYRATQDVVVTMTADSGEIRAIDLDKEQRGIQLMVKDGVAPFEYVAGRSSGTAIIHIGIDSVQAYVSVDLNTPVEKFTLVGLLSGTAQAASARLDSADVNSSKAYPDGLTTDGRAAIYARGTVFGNYRLTASFDNNRRNTSRFFRDLDPDVLYSIYGDNSMLVYDAQTTHPLFARLEHNKTYAMFGDYITDQTKQEFTSYNRTLYGFKAGHQDNNLRLTTFASITDRTVVQLELRGTGLSGFYNLGYLNVSPGSEKVRIETRDRFHSEILLKQTEEYRFSDYEIDYAQGTIFFKQPVPAIDAQGNPVYIVASFEAYDEQKKSYVAGGRVEHDVSGMLTLGVNGVVEEQEPSNYSLIGADMKLRLDERSTLSGEIGRSDRLGGAGLAYKIETAVTPLRDLSLNGYYRKVDKEFSNITQSGSGRELGTKKYGAGGSYQAQTGTKLSADFYRSLQDATDGTADIRSLAGSVDQTISSIVTGMLRLEDIRYTGPARDTSHSELSTHSLLASARVNVAATQKLNLGLQHDRNLGEDQDITKPNGTMIYADYKVIEEITLQGQEKIFEDGSSLSSIGVNAAPFEGTSLYGKYEIGNAIGQHRNMLSIGLKNRVRLPYDLFGNIGFERAKSLETRLVETPTEDHIAYSGSLEYLPERPMKATAKAEYGENNLSTKSNYFFGFDMRVLRDVSVIAKGTLSYDKARQGSGYQDRSHLILGGAYRPVDNNLLNIIGKLELKKDDNHYLAPFDASRATIVSVHAFVEPIRRVELGCKFAYKRGVEQSVDFYFKTHTYFYLISGRYNISDKVDIGGEYRLMRQKEAQDWLIGYNVAVGTVVMNNLRVEGGYNFKGYKERDLVDFSLWSKGPFIRMSYKFDESLFGW